MLKKSEEPTKKPHDIVLGPHKSQEHDIVLGPHDQKKQPVNTVANKGKNNKKSQSAMA